MKDGRIIHEDSYWSSVDIEGDEEISRRWGHSMHVMSEGSSKKYPTLFSLFGSDIDE
eukprot:CAMPEP_0117432866 /NCGR_PEP_ID=MMETSP0758-20121206/12288_1 /TAXON_ID=63605 /ORGANISM="Percolomonas cosmopolitus, Strain AE-1 (ATCC 50343)" /LENGTH=56 /DNA_ID=CAMNT_0005223079 /DNA_START=96 /DNA_END=263 /DNA_ORIENTATION=-